MTRNKGVAIAMSILMTIFMISVVYAASTGILSMKGTATFVPQVNVELHIINEDFGSFTPSRASEVVEVPEILDYQTMYINVRLLYPGDKRTVVFKIKNVGAISTTLGALATNDPDIETTGVKIIWPDLEDVTLLSGETSSEYQIEIEWDVDYYYVLAGSHNFSATITYSQAM